MPAAARARRPVGLLSQLEALRYLEVGHYFKQPSHPIWVVASESHYSLLFATSNAVQATDPISRLEERLLAAFNEFDREGNGFISQCNSSCLYLAWCWKLAPR